MNRLDLPRDLRLNQELKTKVKEQVMARCEDYPCCGHEAGDCPTIDSKGRQDMSDFRKSRLARVIIAEQKRKKRSVICPIHTFGGRGSPNS